MFSNLLPVSQLKLHQLPLAPGVRRLQQFDIIYLTLVTEIDCGMVRHSTKNIVMYGIVSSFN